MCVTTGPPIRGDPISHSQAHIPLKPPPPALDPFAEATSGTGLPTAVRKNQPLVPRSNIAGSWAQGGGGGVAKSTCSGIILGDWLEIYLTQMRRARGPCVWDIRCASPRGGHGGSRQSYSPPPSPPLSPWHTGHSPVHSRGGRPSGTGDILRTCAARAAFGGPFPGIRRRGRHRISVGVCGGRRVASCRPRGVWSTPPKAKCTQGTGAPLSALNTGRLPLTVCVGGGGGAMLREGASAEHGLPLLRWFGVRGSCDRGHGGHHAGCGPVTLLSGPDMPGRGSLVGVASRVPGWKPSLGGGVRTPLITTLPPPTAPRRSSMTPALFYLVNEWPCFASALQPTCRSTAKGWRLPLSTVHRPWPPPRSTAVGWLPFRRCFSWTRYHCFFRGLRPGPSL